MKGKKGSKMSYNGRIKFRKQWQINPATKVHSGKRGKKEGYDRNEWKKNDKRSDYTDAFLPFLALLIFALASSDIFLPKFISKNRLTSKVAFHMMLTR